MVQIVDKIVETWQKINSKCPCLKTHGNSEVLVV